MVHAPVIRNVIKRVIPDVPLKTASAPKKGAIRMTNITDFTDSKFIPSHNYEQLPLEVIKEHARIYSKVLTKGKIECKIK